MVLQNERSIEHWKSWSPKEKNAWFTEHVWGILQLKDDSSTILSKGWMGGTTGAVDAPTLDTMAEYTCRLCKFEYTKMTVRQIAAHVETEDHRQNYLLSKLGGD